MSSSRFVVIDTSVLLAVGPSVLEGYGDATVVLSSAVLTELEGKRGLPDELGYQARKCLHYLDSLVESNEDQPGGPYPVNTEGGMLVFEMNNVAQESLPEAMRDPRSNDKRILAIAKALADDNPNADVIVVSRDMPMRLHAIMELGLKADAYTRNQAKSDSYTGTYHYDAAHHLVDELHNDRLIQVDDLELKELPINTGVILPGALARVSAPGELSKIDVNKQEVFGLSGKSAEQRIALAQLMDDEIPIVSLGGRAGTGKTAIAMAAALEKVVEQRRYSKIMVFRNLHSVGGQELGYLPGSADEKMGPWAQAIDDVLGALCSAEVREEIAARDLIEVLPLTHIRGRTFHNTFVIVDEAQNLELSVLSTVMTRLAESSKIVLTHDVAQRDNLHVGRYDGVAVVIEKLTGSPLFSHTTLIRTERSRAAELVSNLLDVA